MLRKMPMSDTLLQIAAREASEQKQAVLRQQTLVLDLKREGGPRWENATELLKAMREDLTVKEDRLERLIAEA
ncbi:MAG: hypothetical protein ACJ8F3_01845 [Xanthobacteraceae bacterium]